SAKAARELAACDRLHSTRGGCNDTELKELAVSPTKSPTGERAVTIVTPVANMPSASRNSRDEKLGGRASAGRRGVRFTNRCARRHQAGMELLSGSTSCRADAGFTSAESLFQVILEPRTARGSHPCKALARFPE